jgi:hypothetical protein
MMNDSINFWVAFVVWVDSFYNRLVNQAERVLEAKTVWLLERYDLTLTNIRKPGTLLQVMVDMFGE